MLDRNVKIGDRSIEDRGRDDIVLWWVACYRGLAACCECHVQNDECGQNGEKYRTHGESDCVGSIPSWDSVHV